jgi:hypothetical protein
MVKIRVSWPATVSECIKICGVSDMYDITGELCSGTE